MQHLVKKKKFWIWVGVLLVFAVLIGLAMRKKKERALDVETVLAGKHTIVETVTASGRIKPEREIKITPYISGEIIELYVKEGDEVEEGQLLAKIDPDIYISVLERAKATLQQQKAQRANAKARLAQTRAKFEKAKTDFERSKALFEDKVISRSEYDNALSAFKVAEQEVIAAKENVKAAEYSVQSAVANFKEAQENLQRTSVFAPASGTVSSLRVEKGERVSGASQFSSGTELMRIANLNRMIVEVEVNENDIIKVANNDTAEIEVDAYLDKKFKGIVREISTSAETNPMGTTEEISNYIVKILILPGSYQDIHHAQNGSPFRPGMSASVDIRTEVRENVIAVPIQSVTVRTDSTENSETEVVFLVQDNMAVRTPVKTGIQDKKYMEITEGVQENDEVIVAPYRLLSKTLKGGEKVNPKRKKEPF